MERPLVSVCVKCYRNRAHIGAAVASVLAQTYRPLEVLVRDDASDDGSFDEVARVAAAAPADVTVRLARNERNLGSLGNWEKLCSEARGELIVKQDGDDVSHPDRVARIVAAWERDGRRAAAICHSGWQISETGARRGRLRQITAVWPLGAAMAFSRRVWDTFGGASDPHAVDDVVWTWRARMIGPVLEIPDRLVDYRLGSGATADEWDIRRVVETCTRMSQTALPAVRADLARLRARGQTPSVAAEAWGQEAWGQAPSGEAWGDLLDAEAARLDAKARLVFGKTFTERLAGFRAMGRSRPLSVARYLKLAFLLPRPLGSPMLFAYVFARNALRRLGVI